MHSPSGPESAGKTSHQLMQNKQTNRWWSACAGDVSWLSLPQEMGFVCLVLCASCPPLTGQDQSLMSLITMPGQASRPCVCLQPLKPEICLSSLQISFFHPPFLCQLNLTLLYLKVPLVNGEHSRLFSETDLPVSINQCNLIPVTSKISWLWAKGFYWSRCCFAALITTEYARSRETAPFALLAESDGEAKHRRRVRTVWALELSLSVASALIDALS